ncbi:MAG: TetR family transcriptional regulator, partial [Mesorhizobium sp.]
MLETITPMKTAEAREALLESARKHEPEKRGRKASK